MDSEEFDQTGLGAQVIFWFNRTPAHLSTSVKSVKWTVRSIGEIAAQEMSGILPDSYDSNRIFTKSR